MTAPPPAARIDPPESEVMVSVSLRRYSAMLTAFRVFVHILAGKAVAAGVLLWVVPPSPSSPTFELLRQLPGWPASWALPVIVGGVGAMLGDAFNRPTVTRVGLALVSTWAAAMALSYIGSAMVNTGVVLWPVPVYLGWCGMAWLAARMIGPPR